MPSASSPRHAGLPGDTKLVVADMDGTLLDESGGIPDPFWPLLARMNERGIVFAPASGRQYPALAALFAQAGPGVALISENGALVVRDGQVLSSSTVSRRFSEHAVASVRALARTFNLGLVWSAPSCAYVERADSSFVQEASRFYTSLKVVDDLLDVPEDALKFAVYDFAGGSAGSRALLEKELAPFKVVMSSEYWMDVMDPTVDKGVAVRALRAVVGASPDQTVVFGDYLNDLEMFAEATHSFAMANAHPRVLRAARHRAPSNRDHGVLTTLERLLDTAHEIA